MTEETPGDQKMESDRLDPWMEDGNTVLTVQGKHFRVHRSILSVNSEVFKNMFECHELNEGEKELIEQCPVIHLHDATTDVQMVLKAMYDRNYPVPFYERMPLSSVSAFLCLGEKYAIQQLFSEAKARLCCAFESTLNVAARISSSHNGKLQLFPKITDSDPHNFRIMNLLQAMDLQAPLPLAMYQCAVTCPLTYIVDGYEFEGTTYVLTRPNLRSFILLKNILETFRTRLSQSLSVSDSCVVQSSCAPRVVRLWSDDATVGAPFGPWRPEWNKLFCDACRSDLCTRRNWAIQKAWNQVPTAFGFNSWAEVSKSGDFPCAGGQPRSGPDFFDFQ